MHALLLSAAIAIWGDSISLGYTPYLKTLMPATHNSSCELLADFTTSNKSNAGNSARMAACAPKWLSEVPTGTIIHFNAGMHDVHIHKCLKGEITHQIELSDYLMNLQTIIDDIRAAGDVPVFATTTPVEGEVSCHFNKDIKEYNSQAIQLMQSQGVQVDDLYSAVYPIQGYLHGSQGIHFEPHGYDFLAHRIFVHLNQN